MSELNRPARVARARRWTFPSSAVLAAAVTVAALLSAGADARSTATPSNTTPPAITGTAVVGETLTAVPGSWTGTPPISLRARVAALRRGRRRLRVDRRRDRDRPMSSRPATSARTLRVLETATNGRGVGERRVGADGRRHRDHGPGEHGRPRRLGRVLRGIDALDDDGHVERHVARRTPTSGCAAGPTAACPTGRTARPSPARRARPTPSSRPTSGTGSASRSPPRTRRAPRPPPPTRRRSSSSRRRPGRREASSSRRSAGPSCQGRHPCSRASAPGRGETPISYAYQWMRCGADGGLSDGSNCTAISGADTLDVHARRPTTSERASASGSPRRTAWARRRSRPMRRRRSSRRRRPPPRRHPSTPARP